MNLVPQTLLKLLGYTWDDLLQRVQEAIGPQNYATLTLVFGELAKVVDQGLVDYLATTVPEWRTQPALLDLKAGACSAGVAVGAGCWGTA